MITPVALLLVFLARAGTHGLCGTKIRWSRDFNMEDVFGMWYGVGYAQHSPDMTNKPEEIGCVTLYISEVEDLHGDIMDWALPRNNHSDPKWLSPKNNPWSNTPMSGSWLDVRLKREAKRELNRIVELSRIERSRTKREERNVMDDKRLRVVWDEDGQSMEQNYVYSPDALGLWTSEQWRPMEREMISRGIDVWYPDDPPRHPEVIRILKVTPDMLIINHCSDKGGGGIFSLILQRTPKKVGYWQWFDLQKEFYAHNLPNVFRKAAVCAAYLPAVSLFCLLVCSVSVKFL